MTLEQIKKWQDQFRKGLTEQMKSFKRPPLDADMRKCNTCKEYYYRYDMRRVKYEQGKSVLLCFKCYATRRQINRISSQNVY
jgi:hypothetical protein